MSGGNNETWPPKRVAPAGSAPLLGNLRRGSSEQLKRAGAEAEKSRFTQSSPRLDDPEEHDGGGGGDDDDDEDGKSEATEKSDDDGARSDGAA